MIIFFIFLFLILSIIFHEYFHQLIAYLLGDITANSSKSILNPLKQVDFFGTILLPFLLIFITQATIFFGYGKQNYINYYHFKNPKRDLLFVLLAGPLINILIVIILTFISKITSSFLLKQIIIISILINLNIALFNLLPIYPLDGSKIITLFFPQCLFYKKKIINFLIIFIFIYSNFFKWYTNFLLNLSIFLGS